MADQFDAIVIGSGLGGLTAGALYARARKRVLLLERNAGFGGAASTYRHGAMTVEASLHETANPELTLDQKGAVFEALDLYDEIELAPVPEFYEVRCPILGDPFILPHGFDAIEIALKSRFPHQEKNIERFLRQVRRTLKALDYLGGGHSALWRLAHSVELPLEMWAVMRDIRSSLSDVLERYFGDDEAIKIALAANLAYFTDDPDEFWWLAYAVAQGGYLQGGGVYIKGGSDQLSGRLVEIIKEEGGEAKSQCEAYEIELDADGGSKGVRYHSEIDEEKLAAEAPVIFANAAPPVVAAMLPERARESFIEPHRGRPLSISLLAATFGLNRPPSELGIRCYSTMLVPEWVHTLSDYKKSAELLAEAPGDRLPVLAVVDYDQIDSGLRGEGLYPVSVVCVDRVSNWENLDAETYDVRKDAWMTAFVQRLEEEWPGFAAAVDESTVSTARSMRDYLNTPGGAIYGFAMRPPRSGPVGMPRQVETAIEGLWLASAFGGGGGFTGSIGCGAAAARAALKVEAG